MSYLIRVQLPDTPGSLGMLAEAIGEAEGDIQSVDIVESFPDGTVTDDIVVNLPSGTLADALITACSSVEGVEVDSIRPFSGRVDRRGQIQMLAKLAEEASQLSTALETLVAAIPQALTSSWAVVIENTHPIHRLAASQAAPEDDGTIPDDIQVARARILNPDQEPWIPDSWALLDSTLAAAPIGATGMVLVIGRAGGPDFLASEVGHLGDIATILGAVLRK